MLEDVVQNAPPEVWVVLRIALLLSTAVGHLYAAWNYFRSRSEVKALRTDAKATELEIVSTGGVAADMFRVATAQAFLFISALTAFLLAGFGPSARGAIVLVPLVPATLVLTFMSWRQFKRSHYMYALARKETRASKA